MKDVVKHLGFKKTKQTVYHLATPDIGGMVYKVRGVLGVEALDLDPKNLPVDVKIRGWSAAAKLKTLGVSPNQIYATSSV